MECLAISPPSIVFKWENYKEMNYTQDGHHILCFLLVRGSTTIILLG